LFIFFPNNKLPFLLLQHNHLGVAWFAFTGFFWFSGCSTKVASVALFYKTTISVLLGSPSPR